MKEHPTTLIAVLSSAALLVALVLTLTAGAQEPPAAAMNGFTIYVPGVMKAPVNYALQFDGVDDFVSIADEGDFDFDQAFTIEAWAKVPYATADSSGLVAGTRSAPPVPYVAHAWGLSQEERFWSRVVVEPRIVVGPTVVFYACCLGTEPFDVDFGWDALPGNHWAHYAGTYRGGEFSSYLNGELIDRASRNMTIRSVTHVLLGVKEESFLGVIDEVRIWNVARSQPEIQAKMNRTLDGDEPGLVGYWRLDEGRGQAILDSSPHGNNGRLGSVPAPDSHDPTWVVSDAPVQ